MLPRIRVLPALLALPALAAALECKVASAPPDTLGARSLLQADCDDIPDGLSFAWDFGDGRQAVTDQPYIFHAYGAAGYYAVRVTYSAPGEAARQAAGSRAVTYPLPPRPPRQASTILFDASRSRVWTVNPDNHSVVYLDYPSLRRSPEIRVGRHPRNLAQAADGTIWVCNQDDATLTLLDGASGAPVGSVSLPRGSHPYGIVLDDGNGFAYVTAQGTGALLKVGMRERRLLAALEVTPTARGLAMTHDGKRLFVTRFLSPGDEGQVVEVDGPSFQVARRFALPYDASPDNERTGSGVPNALNAVVLRPDEKQAWIVAKKDNVRRGTLVGGNLLDVESTVRTMYGVLDLGLNRELADYRNDIDNHSMAKAIAFSSRGELAFIAAEGSNSVEVYSAFGSKSFLATIGTGSHDKGLAPQGLALHPGDSVLFVQYFTSREIGVWKLPPLADSARVTDYRLVKAVDADSLDATAARGLRLFYNAADPRMSAKGYLACATCHMEGGTDNRVWDFTQRGEGLRNTTTLLGKAGMAQGPLHWSANFDEVQDFEHDIRGPQGGTGFLADGDFHAGTRNASLGDRKAGLSADLDALTAYLASLARAPASPFRGQDGRMNSEAEAGRLVFSRADVGCAACHTGAAYTDSKLPGIPRPQARPVDVFPGAKSAYTAEGFLVHDVGTLKASSGRRLQDTLLGLDTPTLLGIWATAPYLHDGSAATLMEVLTTGNPKDQHGRTSGLSEREKQDLVQFLLQLEDGETPAAGIGKREGTAGPRQELSWRPAAGGIEFFWPGSRRPEVRVFTLAGKEADRLGPASGWRKSRDGWTLTWQGRDKSGRRLSPGVYLAWAAAGMRATLAPIRLE